MTITDARPVPVSATLCAVCGKPDSEGSLWGITPQVALCAPCFFQPREPHSDAELLYIRIIEQLSTARSSVIGLQSEALAARLTGPPVPPLDAEREVTAVLDALMEACS